MTDRAPYHKGHQELTNVNSCRCHQTPIPLTTLPPLPDHPVVSVICPSFNHAVFLEDTINSVLQQDYAPLELIIVDGGSTDGTLDILRKYQHDPRVRWISEPDKGPFEAHNKGLKLAKGHLLGHLPVSDTYVLGSIRERVQEFASDPRLVYVGGWSEDVDEHGVPTGGLRWRDLKKHDYALDDILKGLWFPRLPGDQASLWRRDIAVAMGGYAADVEFPNSFYPVHYLLEAWKRGGYARAVPKVWARFRLHPSQRHNQENRLRLNLDRDVGYRRLSEQYRSYLTSKQQRLLRRTGKHFLLRHRVLTLRQIIPAIPVALGYVWLGGGPHLLGRCLAYAFRKKAWSHLFGMVASGLISLLRLPLRTLR